VPAPTPTTPAAPARTYDDPWSKVHDPAWRKEQAERNERLRQERLAAMEQAQAFELERQAKRAQEQQEQQEFHQRVMENRARISRGEPVQVSVPTLAELMTQRRNEELAERQRQEQERIASLTPRQIWMSTLPATEQARIRKWEQINRMEFPMPQG
jgi:hypothetical protein